MRCAMRPEIGARAILTRPDGMPTRLAAPSDRPNPAPVATGSSTICRSPTSGPPSENPIATDATFLNRPAERAAARGISAAFLYASIAWLVHLHAPTLSALSAYVSASVVAMAAMAAAIALGGWLFAGSPQRAVA